jgi:hypothetical protein
VIVRAADRPLERFGTDGWPVGRPMVVEVHHYHPPEPVAASPPAREDEGWDLLRRLTPYFVIALLAIVFLGSLAGVLLILIPPFMALVATLMASLVTIAACAVALVVALVLFSAVIGRMLHTGRRDRTLEKLAANQAPRP